ncbi:MAG: DUF262 domain-containing protein, partial [Bacteroidales bacterium]|nr:DUF262 domain-containing protein [Bacteroidales bacterium]
MENLTLAVTNIGDLLLRSRITRKKDGKSIDDVKLTIPDYQRPYKWTSRNAIQLLDDIIEAKNSNKEVYRVGTLILRKMEENNAVVYEIVDGQQRVITFSLLLYSLYEFEKLEDRPSIPFLSQDVFDNRYNQRNIPNNLNAFRRRTRNSSDGEQNFDLIKDMKRLRDFVENQCEFIVVIT